MRTFHFEDYWPVITDSIKESNHRVERTATRRFVSDAAGDHECCLAQPAPVVDGCLSLGALAMRVLLKSSVICVILLTGCVRVLTTAQHKKAALVLHDNDNGRRFYSRWIRLSADGRYVDIFSTDVAGQERVKRGGYRIDMEKTHLTLTPRSGKKEHLYRVDYGSDRYWIHEEERTRNPGPGESWLKEVSDWRNVPKRYRF